MAFSCFGYLKGRDEDVLRCLMVVFFCFALVFTGGCAGRDAEPDAQLDYLEWVSPSDGTTVRWLEEINDYKDLKLSKGFWKSVGKFLFGGKEEPIVRPYGVHADQSRLLITDPGRAGVHLMNLETGRYAFLSSNNEIVLQWPIGVTSDGGKAYFTDSSLGFVFEYDYEKKSLKRFSDQKLGRPTGIAFNPNSWLLYVSDTAAHQIVVFGLDGKEKFRFGSRGRELGEFNFPTDVWVDADGQVFVTDSLNARMQVFSARGEPLQEIGVRGHAVGYLDKPKGVAVDSHGNLYICDSLKDAVQVFNADGHYLFKFGEQGRGAGQFWMPAGIYIDKDDKIYVADAYNHRVQVFQYLASPTGDR